jgi:hypothetical protein
MADKEFTYSDVSEHNTKKDLYMVVHDKVYNATSFVDEHPYVAPFLRRTIHLGSFRVVIAKQPRLNFGCGFLDGAMPCNSC